MRQRSGPPFFRNLEQPSSNDLISVLRGFELIVDSDEEAVGKLRRSAVGRAVPLPNTFSGTNADIRLLALGFARGERCALAVPYAKNANA
jgi:hypothetical protein